MSRAYTIPVHQRPSADSPPATVRTYLAALLRERHGVPGDEAASIAAAWRFGRGAELVAYDLQTFRDLFGSEAGMLLYLYARDGSCDNAADDFVVRQVPARQCHPAVAHMSTLIGIDPLLLLVQFFFIATVFFSLTAFRDYNPEKEAHVAAVVMSNHFLPMLAFVISYMFYFNLFPSRESRLR